MNTKTQGSLNAHLRSVGADPADAVYRSILDVVYLIPIFIEKGGTYSKPEGRECPVSATYYPLPTPMMKVSYGNNGNNYLYITREIRDGYPVIKILEHDGELFTYLVHPDHLDIAICYLLEVPV